MGYRSLQECLADLERTGQLVRIEQEIDPYLEAAEIQRRVYQVRRPGPAVRPRQGLPLPDGQQPVRHHRTDALPLPRHARRRCAIWSN